MCKLIPSIFFLIIFISGCTSKQINDPSTEKIAVKHAQEDLDVLSDILKAAHPSLNLYVSKDRFSFLLDSIKSSVTKDLTVKELYNKIVFLTNEIGCSHTFSSMPAYVYDSLQNRSFFFPYPVKWMEDELIVNVVGYDLPQGTAIKYINGEPIRSIMQKLTQYNSVEGFHRKTQETLAGDDFSFDYFLKYGAAEKFELIIKDTFDVEKKVTALPVTMAEWNGRNTDYKYYYDRTEVDYDMNINEEKGYAYLKLSTFHFDGDQKQAAFDHFCTNSFDLLCNKKNISALIIDLRENRGGKLYNSFLLYSYLANQPFNEYEKVIAKIRKVPFKQYLDTNFVNTDEADINDRLQDEFSSSMSNRSFAMTDSMIGNWTPDVYHFDGKVYVITNSSVVSSASYFATLVKNSGRGEIIGEETMGGSYSGNGFGALKYILPHSKITFEFPYAHITYSFKETRNTGHGLVPNYYVPDSYESFKKNNDRQMAFILDSLILNKNQH